jgi:hypothetical protein
MRLPYETLSQIISYLKTDQTSLLQINITCRKLYEISSPLLYKSPTFQLLSTILTEHNGYFVRHLDLHMVPHRWDSARMSSLLCNITNKTPDLELLNLDLCTQLQVFTLQILSSIHIY